MLEKPFYNRILLKLSGEVIAGQKGFGIDYQKATELALEIKSLHEMNIDIGLIIGVILLWDNSTKSSQLR